MTILHYPVCEKFYMEGLRQQLIYYGKKLKN